MANREVTRTRKDRNGDITALCHPRKYWSPRSTQNAIRDIEGRRHSYYVMQNGRRVDIHVVDGPNGKYLKTDPDETVSNNLDDLPDC